MLWSSYFSYVPSYTTFHTWNSGYSGQDWGLSIPRSDKWTRGFLTNCDSKFLDERVARYKKAAELVGTEIRVEDDAYDCYGRPIETYSAIFIEDEDKRGSFWRQVEQLDKDPEKKIQIVTSQNFRKEDSRIVLPHTCNCSLTLLMRSGCQCRGI